MAKILIIEDEPLVRENLGDILDLEGFDVITASNGMAGVDTAKKNLPDLILCDVMMPEMDGYTVLKTLKEDPNTQNIPLIFLTAKADMDSLRSGMTLGADDYITKPYDIESLMASIHNRLTKKANLLSEVKEEVQVELNDLRHQIGRLQPQKISNLTNQLHEIATTLKQLGDHLTPQEIEEAADKLEHTTNAIQRLWINFSLYCQLEMIALNPRAQEAYLEKRGRCVSGPILNEVATHKALSYQRSRDVKLTVQDTQIAISGTNFKRIIEELLDNAFRYSPLGSTVEIVTKTENNRFYLSIIDAGRGIAPEILENLLVSSANSYKNPNPALGLGLAIAKHLVELNGGSLTIESILGQQTIVHLIFDMAT